MLGIPVNFYKDLFRRENRADFHIAPDFWGIDEKVTAEENSLLTPPFEEQEIRDAVFSCYADGGPGPDGMSFMFYHKFWDIVKGDLISMFNDFFNGKLDIYRLNFTMLTLIPKEDARTMKKFRPISLINYSFKIFSKILTVRLGKIVDRLVSPNQSAFIHGRYILESVVLAHELVHSVHSNEEPGIVLKLDYEKAYDRVCWDFLFEVLESRGFSPVWVGWIRSGVCLNGEESAFFKTDKGIRRRILYPLCST